MQNKFKFCTILLTKDDPLFPDIVELGRIDFYCTENPSRFLTKSRTRLPVAEYAIAFGLVDGLGVKINNPLNNEQWNLLHMLLKVWMQTQLQNAEKDIYWIDLKLKLCEKFIVPIGERVFQFQSSSDLDGDNMKNLRKLLCSIMSEIQKSQLKEVTD